MATELKPIKRNCDVQFAREVSVTSFSGGTSLVGEPVGQAMRLTQKIRGISQPQVIQMTEAQVRECVERMTEWLER